MHCEQKAEQKPGLQLDVHLKAAHEVHTQGWSERGGQLRSQVTRVLLFLYYISYFEDFI